MDQFGIMFHGFRSEYTPSNGSGSVTPYDLERVILRYGRSRIISPEEWIDRTISKSLNDDSVCITFDDGLSSQFDLALPVLEKYKVKAFWFINSAPLNNDINRLDVYRVFRYEFFDSVDDYYETFFRLVLASHKVYFESNSYLNFEQTYKNLFPFYSTNDIKYRYIRDHVLARKSYEEAVESIITQRGLSLGALATNLWLSRNQISYLAKSGHEIGLHSLSHPTNMGLLPEIEQEVEYSKNYDDLMPMSNSIRSAAHPCGSYSLETLMILKKLGIVVAFNSSLLKEKIVGESLLLNLQMARDDIANIKL